MSREETRRRREAVSTVHDIVSAMRAIAAGRIQNAQRALESAREYHAVVLRGMSMLLSEWELPAAWSMSQSPTALLVMTSEQPFCGAFNQNILALAESRWKELETTGRNQLIVVGQRGLRYLLARGLHPDHGEPAATSLEGIHDLVKRLAILLGRHYASGEIRSLQVIYQRYQSISEQIPTETSVLPPDLSAVRSNSPVAASRFHRYLSEPELLEGLVDEYAFISLYLLAVESYTSEQASRLVAMDASTRNTEDMLETLIDLRAQRTAGSDHPRGHGSECRAIHGYRTKPG